MNKLNYISNRLKPIWSRQSGWVLTLIWLKCVTNNCVAPYHQLSIEHCNIVKLAENILCALNSRIRGNNDVDQLNWISEPNVPWQENWDNALSCHVESWHQLADKNVARAANRVRRCHVRSKKYILQYAATAHWSNNCGPIVLDFFLILRRSHGGSSRRQPGVEIRLKNPNWFEKWSTF